MLYFKPLKLLYTDDRYFLSALKEVLAKIVPEAKKILGN